MSSAPPSDCLFCRIASGELATAFAYEDEHVVAFHDTNPQAPVHVLVIPRRHIADIAELPSTDPSDVGDIMRGVAARPPPWLAPVAIGSSPTGAQMRGRAFSTSTSTSSAAAGSDGLLVDGRGGDVRRAGDRRGVWFWHAVASCRAPRAISARSRRSSWCGRVCGASRSRCPTTACATCSSTPSRPTPGRISSTPGGTPTRRSPRSSDGLVHAGFADERRAGCARHPHPPRPLRAGRPHP